MVQLTGFESDRFYQVHTIIYCAGCFLFLLLFIAEQFTGVVTGFLELVFCCLSKTSKKDKTFSNDIFSELSRDAQLQEYTETKMQIREVDQLLKKMEIKKLEMASNKKKVNSIPTNKDVLVYHRKRLNLKLEQIRLAVMQDLDVNTPGGDGALTRQETRQLFTFLQKT